MKLLNKDPIDPEVTARVLQQIDQMTPEELVAFLEYRTPGIEETDMTGRFADLLPKPKRAAKAKPRAMSA